jgi:hypothetical protein
MYVEGSYFGDSDLLKSSTDGRDGTAFADCECHLLVIGQKELMTILRNHKSVREEMMNVAQERKMHHE